MKTTKHFISQSTHRLKALLFPLLYAFILAGSSITPLLLPSTVHAATPYNASDVLGQTDFVSNSQGLSATEFNYPNGTALDEVHHRLFVVDSNNNRVLVYSLDSSNNLIDKNPDNVLGQTDFTSSGFGTTQNQFGNYPYGGMFYDSIEDRLFIFDPSNYRVLVFDLSQGISNGMDASFVLGQSDFISSVSSISQSGVGDGGGGLAYDGSRKILYVQSESWARVTIFDLSQGITNGMDASHVLGKPDFITPWSCSVGASNTCGNYGIALDEATQRLFISNYWQGRISVFDVSTITNGEDAVNVLGQPDFTSTGYNCGGTANQSCLSYVDSMAFDPVQQYLYAVDGTNYRVMIFDVASITNGEPAVGVIGKPDFTYGGCQTSQALICAGNDYDQNMAFDSMNRRLYLPDNGNNRVLIFDFANISLGTGDPDTKVTIPDAKFGVPYDYAIPITGTQGTVTCSLESGTLPLNVVITSDCHVKGTPASNTPYTFTVKVTDNNGNAGTYSDSQVLGLTVEHPDGSGSLADTGDNQTPITITATILIALSTTILTYRYYQNRTRRSAWVGRRR